MTSINGYDTNYNILLRRDDGTRIRVLRRVGPFSYTWVTNNVGSWSVLLPPDFDMSLIDYERRVQFWRRPPNCARYLDFQGIIREINEAEDEYGQPVYSIGGTDLNGLLDARDVAYQEGAVKATITADYADDAMRDVIRNTLGTGAPAALQISSTYFSVAPDVSLGPLVSDQISYANALDALRKLYEKARQAGTEIYFGMVEIGALTFQFQVKTTLWGNDRTDLKFTSKNGSLKSPKLHRDNYSEVNYVYTFANGDSKNVTPTTASDSTRTGRSIFATRTGVARSSGATANELTAAANAALVNGRPVQQISFELQSVPGYVFGATADWWRGDQVTVAMLGKQFPVINRSVTVSMDSYGRETISGTGEAYL